MWVMILKLEQGYKPIIDNKFTFNALYVGDDFETYADARKVIKKLDAFNALYVGDDFET